MKKKFFIKETIFSIIFSVLLLFIFHAYSNHTEISLNTHYLRFSKDLRDYTNYDFSTIENFLEPYEMTQTSDTVKTFNDDENTILTLIGTDLEKDGSQALKEAMLQVDYKNTSLTLSSGRHFYLSTMGTDYELNQEITSLTAKGYPNFLFLYNQLEQQLANHENVTFEEIKQLLEVEPILLEETSPSYQEGILHYTFAEPDGTEVITVELLDYPEQVVMLTYTANDETELMRRTDAVGHFYSLYVKTENEHVQREVLDLINRQH